MFPGPYTCRLEPLHNENILDPVGDFGFGSAEQERSGPPFWQEEHRDVGQIQQQAGRTTCFYRPPEELDYPFHDRTMLVTACGRICIGKQEQPRHRVRRPDRRSPRDHDQIWLVSFLNYDLGYIDLEQSTLQTIDNPFGTRLSPMS